VLRVQIVEAWIAVQDVQESQRASFPRRSNSVTSSVDAATPRSRRRFAQNPHKDERVPKMPRVCDCRNLLESLTLSAGWEAGIRTPIPWSRGGPNVVDDFGPRRFCSEKLHGSLGRLRLEAVLSPAKFQVFFKNFCRC